MKKLSEGSDISADSAGIWANEGSPASENAISVMKERGIDISCHRAKNITADLIFESDIILTMSESHKAQLLSLLPDLKNVFTLSGYAGCGDDVPDPYGGSLLTYSKCADTIEYLVGKVYGKIKNA